MQIEKILWGIRGLFCKITFGHFGNFSYIGKPISILGRKNIYIDNFVRIYPGIRMDTYNKGEIVIGQNTSIGQNVHITSAAEKLVIGKDCAILANSFVTNITHTYDDINVPVLKQKIKIETTIIGDGCFIGMGVGILAGTSLGKHCIVGANAVVKGTFPDYCVIAGFPGRIIRRYNAETQTWERT